MKISHNVSIRVIDVISGKLVSEHTGHNASTNTLLTGIAHYLIGDGVLNQGYAMLDQYMPKYISLGTMGLRNQDEDEKSGLPLGIGDKNYYGLTYGQLSDDDVKELKYWNYETNERSYPDGIMDDTELDDNHINDVETLNFAYYSNHAPGFGSDGSNQQERNGRDEDGLGPAYSSGVPINCEIVSPSFPRSEISYKEIIPEYDTELPQTIDVIFSAMVSTGALVQFRNGSDHIFITEVGLWSKKEYQSNSSENGLLAGYRIMPPSSANWDMSQASNREILKQNILRVGKNQVVQVTWKLQLGGVPQLIEQGGAAFAYPPAESRLF